MTERKKERQRKRKTEKENERETDYLLPFASGKEKAVSVPLHNSQRASWRGMPFTFLSTVKTNNVKYYTLYSFKERHVIAFIISYYFYCYETFKKKCYVIAAINI